MLAEDTARWALEAFHGGRGDKVLQAIKLTPTPQVVHFDRLCRYGLHAFGLTGDGFAALRLCHPSGYVREGSLQWIAEALSEPRRFSKLRAATPLIALRTNDWVPVIRERALQLTRTIVARDAKAAILAWTNLPLLRRWSRGAESRTLYQELLDLAADGRHREQLRAVLPTLPLGARHALYARLFRLNEDEWLEAALRDSSPHVRRMVLRTMRTDPQSELWNAFLCDLNVGLRQDSQRAYLALDLPTPDGPASSGAVYRTAALGPSRDSLGARYRQLLALARTPEQRRGALLGLGEYGTPTDLPQIREYLQRGYPVGVRSAALYALMWIAPSAQVETLLTLLRDAPKKLARYAATSLARIPEHVTDAQLERLRDIVLSQPTGFADTAIETIESYRAQYGAPRR